jgi:hypothetical protein
MRTCDVARVADPTRQTTSYVLRACPAVELNVEGERTRLVVSARATFVVVVVVVVDCRELPFRFLTEPGRARETQMSFS